MTSVQRSLQHLRVQPCSFMSPKEQRDTAVSLGAVSLLLSNKIFDIKFLLMKLIAKVNCTLWNEKRFRNVFRSWSLNFWENTISRESPFCQTVMVPALSSSCFVLPQWRCFSNLTKESFLSSREALPWNIICGQGQCYHTWKVSSTQRSSPGAMPIVATTMQSPSLLLCATQKFACCARHFCPWEVESA